MRNVVPVIVCVVVWMLLSSVMFTEVGSLAGYLVASLLVVGGLPFVVMGGVINLSTEVVVSLAAIGIAAFYFNKTWLSYVRGDMIAVRCRALAMINVMGVILCASIALQQIGTAA